MTTNVTPIIKIKAEIVNVVVLSKNKISLLVD
jgi:hypothetical protein